jgi:MIP family channel proteins
MAFYQALLSEFIGTMLLTLICTSTGLPITNKSVPDLHGALVTGFVIATIVVGFGHISGAHINPAVTVSFLVSCEIDLIRALCYIGMQLLGAISGSSLLKFLAPPHAQGNLGLNTITKGVTISQAIIVESITTFMLCYTVHAICDKRREDIGGSKALAVGLSIIVGALFGGPYTGASMNPARSFGPAAVINSWENHWVYWVGPLTGSVVAAIMYTFILKQQPPIVVRTDSRPRSRSFLNKPTLL